MAQSVTPNDIAQLSFIPCNGDRAPVLNVKRHCVTSFHSDAGALPLGIEKTCIRWSPQFHPDDAVGPTVPAI